MAEEKSSEKKAAQPKAMRRPRGIRERLAALAPEHFGDIFSLFTILAFAVGAAIFWFFAWLPSNETFAVDVQASIPVLSDEELEDIVGILKARTEASTALVVPPTRDPFK